ncbi:hypothetical protein GGR51DRAFT_532405 [Nemania sp. FL0031]|nr:hypothetical protein GGR51DRAFT_532405 [Nemania sp. FL0031]
MQYSLTTIVSIVLACASPLAQALPTNLESRASIQQLADAQNQWRADTSVVSQFLSAVPSLSGSKLTSAAQVAFNAENDELLHKKVLDGEFGSDPRIVGANNVLVNQGTFQSVVDALGNFAKNGATMSASEKSALLSQTNNIRCGQVLPAIDTYFHVTGEKLQNGGFLVATRPNNC